LLACETSGDFLFHGTVTVGLRRFEPRQPTGITRDQSGALFTFPPSVFASPSIDVAIYAATLKPYGHGAWCQHREGDAVVITFYADDDTKALSVGKTGFVYVFDRSQFNPVDSHVMPGEWTATVPVVPRDCIPVTTAEFRPEAGKLTSVPRLEDGTPDLGHLPFAAGYACNSGGHVRLVLPT
jgi:hypothetical protein